LGLSDLVGGQYCGPFAHSGAVQTLSSALFSQGAMPAAMALPYTYSSGTF